MEDRAIVELYWRRDQTAIDVTAARYGGYCRAIAGRLLPDARDAEECVNDTWLGAWNAMPDNRPALLAPFLGKITRCLAFNRWKAQGREKRGGGELPLVLEELAECVPSNAPDPAQAAEDAEVEEAVDRFLHTLPQRSCDIFLRRYWYGENLEEIGRRYGMGTGAVKSSLFRSREKLKRYFEQEGIVL